MNSQGVLLPGANIPVTARRSTFLSAPDKILPAPLTPVMSLSATPQLSICQSAHFPTGKSQDFKLLRLRLRTSRWDPPARNRVGSVGIPDFPGRTPARPIWKASTLGAVWVANPELKPWPKCPSLSWGRRSIWLRMNFSGSCAVHLSWFTNNSSLDTRRVTVSCQR